MIKHGSANITAIAKKLDIHHQNAKEHLEVLEKYGIVKKKRYGKALVYEVNYGNPFTLAIKRFLEELGEI
ncbi:MAG: hypothetical protein DRO08_01360 [Thermoprotei archaeon]|nr:MAG: hypothetical protein DRO08_01360 [Thermoprotei archaeon]HDJ94758.1 ArsR family transcriptional regulator [Acidilobales archaeon]